MKRYDSTITMLMVKSSEQRLVLNQRYFYEGETDGSFFGQHLWRPQGKRITITEGELDAASCLEIAPTWAVVSLPSGAASAKKSIQKNLQFLQGYDQIVLFFDNDEAGIEAAKNAATVLPPGKVLHSTPKRLQGRL